MSEKVLFKTRLVTETEDSDVETIGTLRQVGNKCYRWTYNGSGAARALGDVLFGKGADADDLLGKGYQALTAQLMFMQGVVVATTLASTHYGWVQCFGYNASVSVSNATNATIDIGDYLKGVTGVDHVVEDAATQALYKRNIQAMEAFATHTTPAAALKKGFINCLD